MEPSVRRQERRNNLLSARPATGGVERSGHGRRVRRGGPLLCPPGSRRVRSSDRGTEPLWEEKLGPKTAHNPIVWSLLVAGRAPWRKPPKKGPPLRNSTRLVYPM